MLSTTEIIGSPFCRSPPFDLSLDRILKTYILLIKSFSLLFSFLLRILKSLAFSCTKYQIMARSVCITAVDGHTGFAIAELILQHRDFARKVDSVVCLTLDTTSAHAQELKEMGARIVPHKPGRVRDMVTALRDTGCDTLCLVPPAHQNKFDICVELAEAAKKAEISNVCLISSVGCDYADPERQPRLREFIELEALVLATKGNPTTPTGGSPCVIR